MIKAEYKRDMQHNYLIIHDELQKDAGYQEKMLYYNKMNGFIPFHIQSMNGERLISYDVHGYQPLVEVCKRFPLKVVQLKYMVENLFEILYQASEYLLKEDDVLLSIEYMFVSLPSYQLSLCYYAGYQIPIKTQLAEFFERLMTCVDYEDKEAVYLIYTLYMKSKELNVTMADMIHVLKQNSEENDHKVKGKEEVCNQIQARSRKNEGPSSPYEDSCNEDIQNEARKSCTEGVKSQNETSCNQNDVTSKLVKGSNGYNEEPLKLREESIFGGEKPSIRNTNAYTRDKLSRSMYDLEQRRSELYQQKEEPKKGKAEEKKREENLFTIPPAMKAAYEPPNTQSQSLKKPFIESKPPNISRPLTANPRQEEQEILSYPPKYYILAGMILVAVIVVCGLIGSTGILNDSVTKQIEPIKIIGMILVTCIPAGYGIFQLFQPQNRVIKEVTIGLYEPIVHQEVAASVEIPVYEGVSHQSNSYLEQYRNVTKEHAYSLIEAESEKLINENAKKESIHIEKMDNKGGERRTVLLQKGTQGAFPQLISEAPDVVESIPIQECPFFIGTAKNRLNYSLTSPVISRYHAKIEEMDGTYFLSDLSSTNGTFLNGKRLTPEESNILIPGDKISFANISFIFTCPNG